MVEMGLNQSELKVQEALAQGDYKKARRLTEEGKDIHPVHRTIFVASLAFALGDENQAWEAIAEGLRLDGHNYELYMLLGEYYAARNLQQAYLCYENALFYCNNEEDSTQIRMVLKQLSEQGIHVPKTAVVILSYNLLDMTRDCIDSIRETTPVSAREIIVVDNASADGSVEWLKKQEDIKLLCNTENKGFPAGCNQGIGLAEKDSDIFLLNNDTLMTDNALFWLRMGLYENEEVGSVGSVSNHVSNFQAVIEDGKSRREYLEYARQVNIPVARPYLNKMHLVGFALLLKRTVLEQIGLLDERFSPGNWEDNDICLRINLAGYRNVLCRNSFIIHWGSKSFAKDQSRYGNVLMINQKKFFDKWSAIYMDPNAYIYVRTDLIVLTEKECDRDSNPVIMVVGTGCGAFLSCMQERFPDAQIYGMEPHMYMAQIADRVADTIYVDLDEWRGDKFADSFDIILLNDVLERTRNPESVLKEIAKMLKADGKMLISFVNSQHYSRISSTGNPIGLSVKQVSKMLSEAKLTENLWQYTKRIENQEEIEEKIQRLQRQYPNVTRDALLAYQWINIVERQKEDMRFGNKMAVCIPTCGHPDVVADVLEHCAEIYNRYGLDMYYFDSSRDRETEKVIHAYREKKGYDNIYYIPMDPDMPLEIKFERVLMMEGIRKEYTYMWYLKERCWCGERMLRLMYRAMEKPHDAIFIDIEHSDSEQELTVCENMNAFYHRCGMYATSMDATIYHVKSMLRDGFDMDQFHKEHPGDYRGAFIHFMLLFIQLAKKPKPSVCIIAGKDAKIYNSPVGSGLSWRDSMIQTFGPYWIQANEDLPDCYTDKDEVIKKTASLPWLLGNRAWLVSLHEKGILTPEYFEEIKGFWERVSDIPVEDLRRIAYGECSC